MVFDEEDQQYKPRFGYKGINSGIEDVPIIEVKPGQDPYADPWAEARKAKKDAIGKNLKNQKRNENKALGKNVNKSPSPVNSYGEVILFVNITFLNSFLDCRPRISSRDSC